MAYTGTGTEADPYLVSTFADFKTCVGISRAYVKVTDDINAKLEPDSNSINSYLNFACAKVYSEKLCRIHGFKITPTTNVNYVFNSSDNFTMESIVLDDVVIVLPGSNTSYTLWNGQNYRKITISFCEINLLVELYSNRMCINNKEMEFADSVLKIKFSKYEDTTVELPYLATNTLTLNRSVVEINDLPLTVISDTITRRTLLNLSKMEYSIIKISLKVLKQLNLDSLSVCSSANVTNNSIFVISVNGVDEKISVLFSGTNFSNCLADSDIVEGGSYTIDDDQHITLVTDEQLKSEEYLKSIGFIA